MFHLTTAEIAEEEALYVEVKRMEQNERRYRVDRDALMRTVVGLDSGLISIEPTLDESVWGVDRVCYRPFPADNQNKKRRRPEDELVNEVGTATASTKKQRDTAILGKPSKHIPWLFPNDYR